jgi:alpha-L-fucosidase
MKIYGIIAFVAGSMMFQSVVAAEESKPVNDRAAWMDEAKFGLFIHWGVYSKLARGEWVMCREEIPVAEYSKLPSTFNPVKFNVEQWVAVAKKSGMKYITITSKHHDGFACSILRWTTMTSSMVRRLNVMS